MRERFLMEKSLFFVDVIFVKIPITSYARIHFAPCEKIQMIEPQCADGPININKISLPDGCFFKDFGWNPLGCLRASSLNISWSCKMLLKTMKTCTIATNALLFFRCRFCQNSNHFLCADTFRNYWNKKKIEPRLADGPININRKLPAGDAFGIRDAFGMLPERNERRRNKKDTQ